MEIGLEEGGAAQHIGLGTRLIHEAERISLQEGYTKITVISAVGTRLYYLKRGFTRGRLYFGKILQ